MFDIVTKHIQGMQWLTSPLSALTLKIGKVPNEISLLNT